MDIVALFCDHDDFYQAFAPTWQQHLLSAPGRHRRRPDRLSTSEIMTLVIAFQDSDYRTCKHFYRKEVCRYGRAEFPPLISYQRLMECLPSVLVPLSAYLETRLGRTQGIAFIDSVPLPVCHNRRIYSHQVLADYAQRGKSSRGKRKNKLLPLWDKRLLRKRTLIESVGEQLKHVCQIAHTRHRSVPNAFVPTLAALAAYTWHEHKPSLHLTLEEQALLAGAF